MLVSDVSGVLQHTPDALGALLRSAPAGSLIFREAPDAWHPIEVLCHLADGEITDWVPRVRLILGDNPDRRFVPFDRAGGFARYAAWTAAAVLEEFRRLRGENLQYLSGLALSESTLDKTGVHPEFGNVTLRQLLACWATHDMAHVVQIARILERYFGREVGPWRAYFSQLRDTPA
jgi:DinB family protein